MPYTNNAEPRCAGLRKGIKEPIWTLEVSRSSPTYPKSP